MFVEACLLRPSLDYFSASTLKKPAKRGPKQKQIGTSDCCRKCGCFVYLNIACVAWRFWLGALSNIGGRSGGRGQRNREEIGAGATKNRLQGRGPFLSRSVGLHTDRSNWIRMFARQSNNWLSPMGEFQVTEQIISAKQNQNIKEALTGALSILNIRRENRADVLKPELEICHLLQRRDVMAILPTGFGKSMIFLVFAMAKQEMS